MKFTLLLGGLLLSLTLQAEQAANLQSLGFQPKTLQFCVHFVPQGDPSSREVKERDLRILFAAALRGFANQQIISGVRVGAVCGTGAWAYSIRPSPAGDRYWSLTFGPTEQDSLYIDTSPFDQPGDALDQGNRNKFATWLQDRLFKAFYSGPDQFRIAVYRHLYPIDANAGSHLVKGWCRDCVILPLDVKEYALFLRSKFTAEVSSSTDLNYPELTASGQYCLFDDTHQGPLVKVNVGNLPLSGWRNLRLGQFSAVDGDIEPCNQQAPPLPAPMTNTDTPSSTTPRSEDRQ
jgi:hypothetical protein